MKSIVVYFSLEGNTKLIAETIAKELDADVMELKTKKYFSKGKFKKIFLGGKSVIFKEYPKLTNKYIDLNGYDNIFLGILIWVGTYASPFNIFIREYNLYNKNIGLFACNGGGSSKKCFDAFKMTFKHNNFIGEIDFIDPLRGNAEECILKTKEWVKSLKI